MQSLDFSPWACSSLPRLQVVTLRPRRDKLIIPRLQLDVRQERVASQEIYPRIRLRQPVSKVRQQGEASREIYPRTRIGRLVSRVRQPREASWEIYPRTRIGRLVSSRQEREAYRRTCRQAGQLVSSRQGREAYHRIYRQASQLVSSRQEPGAYHRICRQVGQLVSSRQEREAYHRIYLQVSQSVSRAVLQPEANWVMGVAEANRETYIKIRNRPAIRLKRRPEASPVTRSRRGRAARCGLTPRSSH